MTTVADVAAWLEAASPRAPGRVVGQRRPALGRPRRRGRAGHDLPDGHARDGRRGHPTSEAGAIVSHHPVLFKRGQAHPCRPGRRPVISGGWPGPAWRSLSPHTAFDNTRGWDQRRPVPTARAASTSRPLRAGAGPRQRFKVVVFAPESDREAVIAAAFEAGAGRIGAYRRMLVRDSPATGRSSGPRGRTRPSARPGRRETVREWRLEVVCPGERLASVLAAIRAAHSYEEPAIDVYPSATDVPDRRTGRRAGSADSPSRAALDEFAAACARGPGTRRPSSIVGDPERPGRDAWPSPAGPATTSSPTPPRRRRRPADRRGAIPPGSRGRRAGHRPDRRRSPCHRAARRRGPGRTDRRRLPRR